MIEQRKRSIFKAITFRILIILIDATVIFLITRRLDLTIGITAISNSYRTIIYYIHERFWNKTSWGTCKLVTVDEKIIIN